tara:strand:- start:169 stop:1071 length:903 start_codon:yes stop_codon:yes gene_type:complete
MVKLPFGVDINNLIDDLRSISWEACDILLYYSLLINSTDDKREIITSNKNNDPVTKADLKVNELIINRINEIYSDTNWNILSEENTKMNVGNSNNKSDWLWILDPLDGTKDFIQGTGNFAMHLALNHKNKPYLGVVLVPHKNELWISNGEKVWGEKRDGSLIKPNPSKSKSLHDMTLVTSKNHNNQTLKKLIQKINFNEVKIMGSIGCKIATIVRGESDLYICLSLPGESSPKDWDFSAPETILKAAGGAITNLDNEDLSYGQSNFEQRGIIVASNDYLMHRDICLEIREIIKKNDLYPL